MSTGAVTRKGLRLALERVARLGDRQRTARRGAALLGDVRHLVRDQLVAVSGSGPVLAGAEEDVAADREGARLDGTPTGPRGARSASTAGSSRPGSTGRAYVARLTPCKRSASNLGSTGRTMALSQIVLDDRKFQDLVNEARLRITRTCPEWTEHN